MLAARMLNQQKSAMPQAEFLQRQPEVERVVYPRLANFAQRGLAHRQMTTPDGSPAPATCRILN
jgi:cystathionine beta-lyase/cystathionine gamma-synthase